jgi:heme/copper-type cytochrome/quinol oxidase subunit 2
MDLLILLIFIGIPFWGVIDAAARPDHEWTEAGQSKIVWVLVQVFLGILGAAAYFLAIRPKLKARSQSTS